MSPNLRSTQKKEPTVGKQPWLGIATHSRRTKGFSSAHELDILVGHARIAAPHCRGLSRQEPVGCLRHSSADAMKPFLTRGFTQDGVLIVIHFIRTNSTRVHRVGRRMAMTTGVQGELAAFVGGAQIG